jgi:dihydropteroate synthase
MGVLNRTPDSFSDGGLFESDGSANARIDALVREGAEIVDIGAESTRPGAPRVDDAEQLARLGGSIEHAARTGALVSIDTTSPRVAQHALERGATIVNSVSLEPAAELGALAARHGAALVLMHSRGPMEAMPGFSLYDDAAYGDVVADVARELGEAAARALAAGLPRESLLLDPGLGFAKNARQSLTLTARLGELCALGFPLVVGPSRKSFLAHATRESADSPLDGPEARLGATVAACLACASRGAAILRVHDVAVVARALAFARALGGSGAEAPRV